MITKIIAKKTLSDGLIKLEIKTSDKFPLTNPGEYIILHSVTGKKSITLPIFKNETGRETLIVLVPIVTDEVEIFIHQIEVGTLIELEGPLGQAFRIGNFGNVLCVADYDCLTPLLPVISALRASGNKITCMLTQNQGTHPLLETEIRKYTDNWIITNENQNRTTHLLEQNLRYQKYDQLIGIGHTRTIRETSTLCTATRTPAQQMLFLSEKNLQGQHGIFKVSTCEKTHSICIDGHDYNAHFINFEEVAKKFKNKRSEIKSIEKIETNR